MSKTEYFEYWKSGLTLLARLLLINLTLMILFLIVDWLRTALFGVSMVSDVFKVLLAIVLVPPFYYYLCQKMRVGLLEKKVKLDDNA